MENIVYNNSRVGIWLGGRGSTVIGNVANNNHVGMILSQMNNEIISGNIANNNTDVGIYLYQCDRNNISGNTAEYNDNGISLDVSDHNTISGNTLTNNSGAGIFLVTICYYNVILENNINNNWGYPLRIYGSRYNIIYFNNFKNR